MTNWTQDRTMFPLVQRVAWTTASSGQSMPVSRFLEPLISAVFLTSVTVHLIYHRRSFADERSRLVSQTTILHDLVQRLRGGERIPDDEYDRLIALARRGRQDVGHTRVCEPKAPEVGWRDTILGRKPAPPTPHNGGSDERSISKEWDAAVQPEASSSSTSNISSPATPSTPVAPSFLDPASKQPDPNSRANTKVLSGQRQHPEYL